MERTSLAVFTAALALLSCKAAPRTNVQETSAASDSSSSSAPRPQHFAAPGLPPPTFADPHRKEKLASAFPAMDEIYAAWFAKSHAPGLAVGVIIDGELAWSKGYGVRDLESKTPVDADTQFRIASMSKSFTAMAILELRDQGKLGLDDPAAKYVPELASLAYPTRDSPLISLRHLLTHGAGFPEDNPSGDRLLAMGDADFGRWIAGGIPFSHTPGTAFEYANLGFDLLGRVVTQVSGTRYQDFIGKTILGELGMASTTYDVKATAPEHVAVGYRFEDEKHVIEPSLGDGAAGAMGGLFTTVKDMAKYAAYHLSAWPPRDDPEQGPLRRSSLREMQQGARHSDFSIAPQTTDRPARGSASAYGYGLSDTETCDFGNVVAHGGGLPGWGSWIVMLPDRGVAMVAMANLTYSSPSRPTREALSALLKTGGLAPRVVRPAPALLAARDGANRMLERWDDAELSALVAENFFLDESKERWRAKLDKLQKAHGACHPDGEIEPENALRGRWKMMCERGSMSMWISLAPTNPPTIQKLEIDELLPPEARLTSAAERIAKLTSAPSDVGVSKSWFDEKADVVAMTKAIADAAYTRGACTVDHATKGDGKTTATFDLRCSRAPARLTVELDDATGKVKSFRFSPGEWPMSKCTQ